MAQDSWAAEQEPQVAEWVPQVEQATKWGE
jgi:hypothetical protein